MRIHNSQVDLPCPDSLVLVNRPIIVGTVLSFPRLDFALFFVSSCFLSLAPLARELIRPSRSSRPARNYHTEIRGGGDGDGGGREALPRNEREARHSRLCTFRAENAGVLDAVNNFLLPIASIPFSSLSSILHARNNPVNRKSTCSLLLPPSLAHSWRA